MSLLPATRYRIAPVDPRAHRFEVACTVADPAPSGQRFRLPVWIPGSYLVRDFARSFVSVRAHSGGASVRIDKEAKDVWRAAACDGPLTVVAEVHASDLSVRTAFLDTARGYFNGACVFLCPEGREDAPCVVDIVAPQDPACTHWRIATTLEPDGAAPWQFGTYRASDYDALIDHPVEMSDFAQVAFEAGGVTHDITISGRHDADLARLAADMGRICQWHIDLFGGKPPFRRYLFQVTAVGEGHGGLEHRSSTSLVCARRELPRQGDATVDDDYRTFLGLASHEYFHSWNVKRIKPAAFTPYDLSRENYTRLLWAFEGITSYYDDLALVRSGVISTRSYLELLGRAITTVLRTPGRRHQSVAQSSFDAWIKYYRPDENTPNAVVSYYAKGALIGVALDLTLRQRGASLDALMRALWERHGRTGVGVPEDGIARLAAEIAGGSLDEFFLRYVDGIEDPPLADLLAWAGIHLKLRAAESQKDKGGKRGKSPEQWHCWLGARWTDGSEIKVLHVMRDGPAMRAGLAPGDVLVAVDGLRVSAEQLETLARQGRPGRTITVHAFRRDELMTFDVVLAAAPTDTAWLEIDTAADAASVARRSAWLGR